MAVKLFNVMARRTSRSTGATRWEVDALNPKTLATIIETALREVCDIDKYNAVLEREKEHRKNLRLAVAKLVKEMEEGEEE